jgi:hypothetical protein
MFSKIMAGGGRRGTRRRLGFEAEVGAVLSISTSDARYRTAYCMLVQKICDVNDGFAAPSPVGCGATSRSQSQQRSETQRVFLDSNAHEIPQLPRRTPAALASLFITNTTLPGLCAQTAFLGTLPAWSFFAICHTETHAAHITIVVVKQSGGELPSWSLAMDHEHPLESSAADARRRDAKVAIPRIHGHDYRMPPPSRVPRARSDVVSKACIQCRKRSGPLQALCRAAST